MKTSNYMLLIGLILGFTIPVQTTSASTLVVNQTSPCTAGDFYFSDIQSAVNHARIHDVIMVCPGTYIENVRVYKSVTIESFLGPSQTIIIAANPSDHVFRVRANNVKISGFSVMGAMNMGTTDWFSSGIYLNGNFCILTNNSIFYNGIGIYLECAKHNTIKNNTINSNTFGIYLFEHSDENTIDENVVESNVNGIFLYLQNDANKIVNNVVKHNRANGIYVIANSSHNIIANNMVSSNTGEIGAGIVLGFNTNNTITNNTVSLNGQYGILMYQSDNNKIMENNIISNVNGISLVLYSNDNIITNNTIESNENGLYLFSSFSNQIYHNNIVNNKVQAHDNGANIWNDSYPSAGNFWSDLAPLDYNSDGVVDEPYPISGGDNLDSFPVVNEDGWLHIIPDMNPPTITFVNPTPANNSVARSNSVFINVTTNEPSKNVILEWDGAKQTMLGFGKNWYKNVTNLINGLYTYRVYASDVVGNVNISETRVVEVNSSIPDVSPPAILIISPKNNTTYFTDTVDLTCTVDEEVSLMSYKLDDQNAIPFSPDENVVLEGLEDGLHTLTVYATDTSGNSNSSTVWFMIDTSCTLPSDDLNISESVKFCPGLYNITDSGKPGVLIISSSNIVVDCNNATFKGNFSPNSIGIYNLGFDNVTVKNCIFENYDCGIHYAGVSAGGIANNLALSNNNGINLKRSTYITIINNTANYNLIGINLRDSSGNKVTSNIVKSNLVYGIQVKCKQSRGNNTIANNTVESNLMGIYAIFSRGNVLANNNATSNVYGILLGYETYYNLIFNNSLSFNTNGMYLWKARKNVIMNNSVTSNTNGIYLFSSSNDNDIVNNTVSGSIIADLYISSDSFQNDISNTFIDKTEVSLQGFGYAIRSVSNPPADPPSLQNISKYLNITETNPFYGWASVKFHYNQEDLHDVNEFTLRVFRFNPTGWEVILDSGVDVNEDYVYANLSEFGIIAPFGKTLGNHSNLGSFMNDERNI